MATGTVPGKSRPQPKGGSRKGKPNKVPSDLRAMVLEALAGAGGVDYLERQAKKRNPAPFLALVGKCLPKEIRLDATITLTDLLKQAEARRRERAAGGS